MTAERADKLQKSPLARIGANLVWLLGGKGFGAVCGVVYLAILARSLGLKDFGHFSLIFGTAQALIAVAGFQTWRVVVRYGSEHVHNRDWDKFGRLGLLCGVIDAIGAVFGCLLAGVIFFGFNHLLDLNPAYVDMAFWFSCVMVWALVSAPTGIVRALHRFDKAVYVEAIVPAGRLIGSLLVWLTGPSVKHFLIVWALVDVLEAIAYWYMARRLCPQAVRMENLGKWRRAFSENPGIRQFFLVTYASATLDAIMRNGPLLAVGGLVGTKAAGLYRLAAQITQSMSKLSTLLTRAVYAEVARVRVASAAAEFRKLAIQASLLSGLAGLIVVGIALVAGEQVLILIGGDDFGRGASILVPLAIAASFELASVVYEPVLHSTGKARLSLTARFMAVAALGIALLVLDPMKGFGVAWAAAIASGVSFIAMGAMAAVTIRRMEREESSTPG